MSELLSSGIKFVPTMKASELRSLAKSVEVANAAFPNLEFNNYLLKQIDKRLVEFAKTAVSPEDGHSVVCALSTLARLRRQTFDGGPPPLRPDTAIRFLHAPYWKNATVSTQKVLDKCEYLSVLSKLNIRPYEEFIGSVCFSAADLEALKSEPDNAKIKGRVCGAVGSLVKLDLTENTNFQELVNLVPRMFGELSLHELSSLSYSVALGSLTADSSARERFFIQILRALVSRKSNLSLASLSQVGVAHSIWLCINKQYLEGLEEVSSFARECVVASASKDADKHNCVHTSKAQAVVRKAIDKLGIGHLAEDELAVGPFRVDLGFTKLKFGIEVNGPYHFYFASNTPTAKTRMKRHVLQHVYGYRTIDLTHEEIKSVSGDKSDFIERKIRECLHLPSQTFRSSLKVDIGKLVRNSVDSSDS